MEKMETIISKTFRTFKIECVEILLDMTVARQLDDELSKTTIAPNKTAMLELRAMLDDLLNRGPEENEQKHHRD